MKCPSCGNEFGEWKNWKNQFPTYFQSLENEIRECGNCGTIQFKYKPEGKEYRPEWTEEECERIDIMIEVIQR